MGTTHQTLETKNVSCEIEGFVETLLCKPRATLRSRVPWVLCDLVAGISNIWSNLGQVAYIADSESSSSSHSNSNNSSKSDSGSNSDSSSGISLCGWEITPSLIVNTQQNLCSTVTAAVLRLPYLRSLWGEHPVNDGDAARGFLQQISPFQHAGDAEPLPR